MRLSGQFHCLFFYEKILNAQKRKSNQNQLTKQKQANKKLLSNCFCLFISAHKSPWPNRQDRLLSLHETFKNAGSKTVRGRLHGCGIVTSKEALGT